MDKQRDVSFLTEKTRHQTSNSLILPLAVTLKRILMIDSQSSNTYVYDTLGVIFFQQSNFPNAEKLFKRALMMDPTYINAYYNLGACFAQQNDYKKASKAFQTILQIDPTSLPALNAYGQALFEIGDFHKAVEQFTKVLAMKPKDLDANNNMGLILLIQQRYEEARKCFKFAIDHNKDEKSAFEWINWSMAEFQLEKKEAAMEIFKEGMTLRDKSRNQNHQKQEIIEIYARTLRMLEKRSRELRGQEEKVGVDKTITGIKFILDLLENFIEEKS